MRSLIVGATLLAFAGGAAMAQQPPDPNADITTPSTPAPAVNKPSDMSMKSKGAMAGAKHHRRAKHHKSMKKSM